MLFQSERIQNELVKRMDELHGVLYTTGVDDARRGRRCILDITSGVTDLLMVAATNYHIDILHRQLLKIDRRGPILPLMSV